MHCPFLPTALGFLLVTAALHDTRAEDPATYRIVHSLKVKDVPADARQMRVWFWLPDDDEAQKVLDLAVRAPASGYRITRDATNGHRYLYAEFKPAAGQPVAVETNFLVTRRELGGPIDPAKTGPLTETHRTEFAEYLRRDTPNMEVSERLAKIADDLCGKQTNVIEQVRKIYDYVIEHSDHYSISGAPKTSGLGSADYCLDQKGGGCTDQHSLFIALARARGIPTRLQFGSRLQAKNEGKEVDAGYRCWVQYFVPGYGWTSTDVSAGDTTPAERARYMSSLDNRRVRFLEGRDLTLNPPQAGGRVNLVIGAYIEIDGKPHAAFDRTIKFEEIRAGKS